jgi:hypothetical protein
LRQGDGTEDALQTCEGMIGSCGAALEYILAVLACHDDGITAVGRFASFAEVALKVCERRFHANQVI